MTRGRSGALGGKPDVHLRQLAALKAQLLQERPDDKHAFVFPFFIVSDFPGPDSLDPHVQHVFESP